jgi:arginyl-tRNA synthetase
VIVARTAWSRKSARTRNQFWKLGLLGRISLPPFHHASQRPPLWATTSSTARPMRRRSAMPPHLQRHRLAQMCLQALLSALGAWTRGEAENSITSRTRWSRSRATARKPVGARRGDKPFVEVSGRKGLGVKIDDLLDVLMAKASTEVAKRNPEFSEDERAQTAARIAVAAIRYFMLKFSRGKLIVFDMEEALSFEGETGPYLQYAVVRANNIFGKLKEREGLTEADLIPESGAFPADEDGLWALVLEAARLDEVVEQVVRSLEFSSLAKYAFGLAQLFNGFYHRSPILNEKTSIESGGVRRRRVFPLAADARVDLMGLRFRREIGRMGRPSPFHTHAPHWIDGVPPRSRTTVRLSFMSGAKSVLSIPRWRPARCSTRSTACC